MRRLLVFSVLLLSLPATAWESVCYERADPACEACSEFTLRHLRVGTDLANYDTTAEPLCHYLSGGPYLYQSGPGTPETLARTWCHCP
jgi:hypothetical protein